MKGRKHKNTKERRNQEGKREYGNATQTKDNEKNKSVASINQTEARES